MPRYRFSWSNFPVPLIERLAADLGLNSDDPAIELRRSYGARPKLNFIQDAWPTLQSTWLVADDFSRGLVVEDLRASGLGRIEGSTRSKKAQLEYLATCRNARSLREIVLDVFLVAGEPNQFAVGHSTDSSETAESPEFDPLTQSGGKTSAPALDESTETVVDGADLNTWVEGVIGRLMGSPPRRDADGDIPIHRGSSVVYVRQHEHDSPFLEVFSVLLSGFEMSPSVYEAVNAINAQVPMAKTTVNRDETAIGMNVLLFVESISEHELCETIDIVSASADHFDNLLQKRFGGHTALEDDPDGIEI
ncbi:T3SS (YopN, CesT) and YbjN peptide-binding chaperone 1 [Rhodococcoides fascians]|uniref:T3SS (YopN, CesT) and YbjN peptide-binding chaperone 1 n=1 Tax=Rhodococcoides fascians TaxID=1828 RepID=UPI0012D3634B|nr:YbjN domain-containing protein [Rhodococcus fascians]